MCINNSKHLHLKEILSFQLSQYTKYISLPLDNKKYMYPFLFCYNAYFNFYWKFISLISFISTIQPGWGLGGNNLSTFVHTTNLSALVTCAQYVALRDTCTISLLHALLLPLSRDPIVLPSIFCHQSLDHVWVTIHPLFN